MEMGKLTMKRKFVFLLLVAFSTCFAAEKTTDAIRILSSGNGTNRVFNGLGGPMGVDTVGAIIDGDLWIWGYGGSGQGGNGSTSVHINPPARVNYFVNNKLKIIDMAMGAYHVLALDENGDVWGWGMNATYRAVDGTGAAGNYISTPVKVISDQNVIQLGSGEYVSYALTKDGRIYSWGLNAYGQIGNGTYGPASSGEIYQIPTSKFDGNVLFLGQGYETGFAITENNTIYGWGDNEWSAFGYDNGSTIHEYVSSPKKLSFNHDSEVIHICNSDLATMFLTSDGTVYGMGLKNQLGQGIAINTGVASTYKTVSPVKILDNVSELFCRYGAGIAYTNDNNLYMWGTNLGSLYSMIYSANPSLRYSGELCQIIPGKDRIIYVTTDGTFYGVGYQSTSGNTLGAGYGTYSLVSWPGNKLTHVMNEMKAVYGDQYLNKVCGN